MLDKLREINFYSGRKDKIYGEISVTEITGGDVLQSHLGRQHKVSVPNKLSQSTLGSIFDIGMRVVIERLGLTSGTRINKTLPNGWVLTGEPDVLDEKHNIIYDMKLSKIFAFKKTKSEGLNNGYVKQLNFYKYMLGGEWSKKLIWGLKDQSDVKLDHPREALVLQDVPDIDNYELEKMAVEFTDKLDKMKEDNFFAPDKCLETWGRDMRCEFYCSVSSVCSYAKKKRKTGASSW